MQNNDLDVVRRLEELDATSRAQLLDFIGQDRREAPTARQQDKKRDAARDDGTTESLRPKLRH
ncbi:MAG: hypothetical protein GC146_00145 [Limimaricola sp.]|uniref:hypothetical protein n=1 Tax=Limimaricola sp. TaxID=2211665 RepID=UPI001E106BA2|nr:hypothetical protein [Limimaricola sp.]MBI1415612.1 hypothetical protein [Limimaricola sp.]